jgi:hypothetical protein
MAKKETFGLGDLEDFNYPYENRPNYPDDI